MPTPSAKSRRSSTSCARKNRRRLARGNSFSVARLAPESFPERRAVFAGMRATVNIGICGGGRPRNFAATPRVYFLQTLASLAPKKYRFSRCRRAGRKPVCPLKGARCVFSINSAGGARAGGRNIQARALRAETVCRWRSWSRPTLTTARWARATGAWSAAKRGRCPWSATALRFSSATPPLPS